MSRALITKIYNAEDMDDNERAKWLITRDGVKVNGVTTLTVQCFEGD